MTTTVPYQVQFVTHIRANFEANVLAYVESPVKCRGSIHLGWESRHEGQCDKPVLVLFAWHFNDDRQGELNALCEDHLETLVDLANFTPNTFFMDVAETIWITDLEDRVAEIKVNPTIDPLADSI